MAEETILDYALCTVEDVKYQLSVAGLPYSQEADPSIVRYINHFTAGAEGPAFCNTKLKRIQRTIYFDAGSWFVQVDATPIAVDEGVEPFAPLVQVFDDVDRAFGAETELTLWEDFNVEVEQGIIRRRLIPFGGSDAHGDFRSFWAYPRAVKVIWTGGLVIPAVEATSTPAIVPDDLRNAAALQIATWWKRRQESGVDAMAIPGAGSMSLMPDPTKLLDNVWTTLRRYRRFSGGF